MQKLEANYREKIENLEEQRRKEMESNDINEGKLRLLKSDLQEAIRTESELRRELHDQGRTSTTEEDDKNSKLDKYRLKFSVEMLNEYDVIKQLDTEIEEFNKLLEYQIKEMRPTHQSLISNLTDIMHGCNPEYDVFLECDYRFKYMGRMLLNCVYHPLI